MLAAGLGSLSPQALLAEKRKAGSGVSQTLLFEAKTELPRLPNTYVWRQKSDNSLI